MHVGMAAVFQNPGQARSDRDVYADMNAAWDAWIDPANTPARATVEARLASPKYLVEIMAVAAI